MFSSMKQLGVLLLNPPEGKVRSTCLFKGMEWCFTQQMFFLTFHLKSGYHLLKLFRLHWFNAAAAYLFSIIIWSCFLNGDISEMYIYSVNMLRTENSDFFSRVLRCQTSEAISDSAECYVGLSELFESSAACT